MRLQVRILGTEVLAIETDRGPREPPPTWHGDVTTTPIGFVKGDHE